MLMNILYVELVKIFERLIIGDYLGALLSGTV